MPPTGAIIPPENGDGEDRDRAAAAFGRLAQSNRPLLLFVTHARAGGVARHVQELAELVAGSADVLVLRAHRRSWLALAGMGEHSGAALWLHRDRDWPALVDLARALRVTRVHFHHVQGLPASVLEIGRAIGCLWDVTLHDYFPACPQYQLTDASGRYCGEPDEDGCARCLAVRPAQWPMGIAEWRGAFARLLGGAARVIAPSQDAATRITRHFPGVTPFAWPHWDAIRAAPREAKVLVLGALSPAKGMSLLEGCAADARARGLALRFRVVGQIAWPVAGGHASRISFTGGYAEGTLPSLIEQERGDAIFFPAQWPETYSYTLSAAIASGLPIVATDLGALPERTRGLERARILPWNAAPAAFNDALLQLAPSAAGPEAAPCKEPAVTASEYRARYLAGIPARPGPASAAAIALPGTATAPDEPMPQATLVELYDDGVRCGAESSLALLRSRLEGADRAQAEAARLREDLVATAGRSDALAARLEASETALAASRAEVARLATVAAAARDEAAAYEESTSWRLTAPLRALARLLGR